MEWARILAYITGTVDQELLLRNDYLAAENRIEHLAREFAADDMQGKVLVIAATDRQAVNRHVSELARTRNLPVNVVDQPELCTFIMPSVIDRSPVQVAISTGGASPVLARLLRARLESYVPAAYGRLANLVKSFRDKVKQRFANVIIINFPNRFPGGIDFDNAVPVRTTD